MLYQLTPFATTSKRFVVDIFVEGWNEPEIYKYMCYDKLLSPLLDIFDSANFRYYNVNFAWSR